MTDRRSDPTERMQRTSINQAQTAFEQSFELQRNATKMFLSMLEMQDTAGRQGIEITKSLMRNYLQGVEAIMPEMERAMEEGMAAAPTPGGMGSRGGRMPGGRMEGGERPYAEERRQEGRMEPGREMHGGGEPPEFGPAPSGELREGVGGEGRREPEHRGERQYEQRRPQQRTGEPISQPAGSPGGHRGPREGGGGRRGETDPGRQQRHEGESERYGRTGRWVPQEGAEETRREPLQRYRESARGREHGEAGGRSPGEVRGHAGTYQPTRREGGGPEYGETPARRMEGGGEAPMDRREEPREPRTPADESEMEGRTETREATEHEESTGGESPEAEEVPDRAPGEGLESDEEQE